MTKILLSASSLLIAPLLLLFPSPTKAQYDLPKHEILAANGVKIIHVDQTPLHYVDIKGKIIEDPSFDGTSRRIATYFLNDRGWIDSVYYHPTDKGYWEKDMLTYDADGRMVGFAKIDASGKEKSRNLIEKLPDGGWKMSGWEHGQLKLEIFSTPDSIKREYISYRMHYPDTVRFHYLFDLEKDIRTETWIHGQRVVDRTTDQWITENGVPSKFLHSTYEWPEGRKKPKTESYELQMDSTGMVINKLNGLFTDPFISDGYYRRHEEFRGLSHPHHDLFRMDSLVPKQEKTVMWSFDGTDIVYRFDFGYL